MSEDWMELSSELDGGRIEVVDVDGEEAELQLLADTNADFMQWFHFEARYRSPGRARHRIVNAGDATYQDAWEGYRVVASSDGATWYRVPTTYEDGVLAFEHDVEDEVIQYAYFAPFTWARHER